MNNYQEANYRHASYYLNTLKTFEHDYQRDNERMIQALVNFDKDSEQINSAQKFVEDYVDPDENDRFAKLASQFPYVGQSILNLRFFPDDRIKWLKSGLAAARALTLIQEQVSHLTNLGLAFSDLGQLETAVNYYEEALQLARKAGYQEEQAIIFSNLGTTLGEIGRADEATSYHQKAIKIFKSLAIA